MKFNPWRLATPHPGMNPTGGVWPKQGPLPIFSVTKKAFCANCTMKKQERSKLLKQYGHLYRKHVAEGVSMRECFYCADPADTVDHCPPIAWIDSRAPEAWRSAGIPLALIGACRACNGLLGDKPLFTALDRLLSLENALEKRYEREVALWSDDEIAEMGPEFQRTIKARKAKSNHLLGRIRNVQRRALREDTFPVLQDAST